MKNCGIALALCVLAFQLGFAQTPVRLAKTNGDCLGAVLITDTIMGPMVSPLGYGNELEIQGKAENDPKWFEREHNTIWFKFVPKRTQYLAIDITPESVEDDFDFLLFESSGPGFCKRVKNGEIDPIRTNISRNNAKVDSKTGLSLESDEEFVKAGPGNAYSKAVQVIKGQEYYLVLDNPNQANRGLSLYINLSDGGANMRERLRRPGGGPREEEPPKKMKINILDAETGQPMVASISVEGVLSASAIEFSGQSSYDLDVRNYRIYTINASAQDYMLSSTRKVTDGGDEFSVDIKLSKIEKGAKVRLENIKFVGNKAEILPKSEPALFALGKFMTDNPEIKIEVQGHVNGVGKRRAKKYKKLSTKRAKAVYNFLILKGIEGDRMKWKGYGSTQMLYDDPITPEQEEANRRVEVEILSK